MLEDRHGRRAKGFALQWHLTHACEMHCKHCYDRRNLRVVRLEQALGVVEDYLGFCAAREVAPSVLLSGGNPFLYPWFFELYRHLVERGVPLSILGNPVSAEELDELVAIRAPRYYQISLEGLEAANDAIRGDGSYRRALEFLPRLRERKIRSVVMVTLTDRNIDEILPLSGILAGKTDKLTFNRLSQTGEGAALGIPDKMKYGTFMIEYMAAAKVNHVLGFKDNLFNIFRHELGMPLGGGCTGYGCGAAFNFVALLPNGEVHACRKLPSKIGNVLEQRIAEIYDSPRAQRYRDGCSACDGCAIRSKCGGCLAVATGHGLDPFVERDPHCFMYD